MGRDWRGGVWAANLLGVLHAAGVPVSVKPHVDFVCVTTAGSV